LGGNAAALHFIVENAMKLMISGKGGAGKSTVAALLAKQCVAAGKRVVVVDTDVSNIGLHRILGVEAPQDFTGIQGDRKPMRGDFRPPRGEKIHREMPPLGSWTYETLPKEYSSENNGIKLISIGKIRNATQFGKGRWVGLTRRFLAGLQLSDGDQVLVDTDAGVEHLARGMGGACDAVLVVVDTSYESILMTKTVSRMVAPLNIPYYFVLNKTNAATSRTLRNALADTYRIIGEFPQDMGIYKSGLEGSALGKENPVAKAVLEKIESLGNAQTAM
jgi:CO dehydrogenase maturation factor